MTLANRDSTPSINLLSNGVTLLHAPIEGSRNVGVTLIVKAGSRDETAETAGLAHFLEHLFFKGTVKRPTSMDISLEIDRLGAQTNAYTDTEEVAYYAEGPATATDQLADIITDMLCQPLFDPEEVERERNVVLQELAARLLRPQGWISDRLPSVTFGGNQPMAWSAAGFPAVIAEVPHQAIVDYHSSFYAPSSMALVISGGAKLSVSQAEELLAKVPNATPKSRQPAVWGKGDPYVANVRPLTADQESQVDLCLASPGIPALASDRTALGVMSNILGGTMSSRLFHKVREREGLCYRISASHEAFDDAGIFAISTATRPSDACRTVELSMIELHRLAKELVPADELAATKSSMIGRLMRNTETAGNSSHWYATRWRAGMELETPDQRTEAIQNVTAEEVLAVAKKIVEGVPQMRLALVGPEDQGKELLEVAIHTKA